MNLGRKAAVSQSFEYLSHLCFFKLQLTVAFCQSDLAVSDENERGQTDLPHCTDGCAFSFWLRKTKLQQMWVFSSFITLPGVFLCTCVRVCVDENRPGSLKI